MTSILAIGLAALLHPFPATPQLAPAGSRPAPERQSVAAQAGRYYLSGSFSLSFGMGADSFPGRIMHVRQFYGRPARLTLNGAVAGGVLLWPRVSVGGELTLMQAQSTVIEERLVRRFEGTVGTSTYTNREPLVSVIARTHFERSRLALQPLGGLTVAYARQSLRDRKGTYFYHAGAIPTQEPDLSQATWRAGAVGGADVLFRSARELWLFGGVRVHRLSGTGREHPLPDLDHWLTHVSAGVVWRPGTR